MGEEGVSTDHRDNIQTPRDRSSLFVPLVLALLAVSARWLILRSTHSTTEDFLITLRYADNLAAGRGFVYNPGEHVLGTTTPLYTLILALAAFLHLDPALAGKSLNILSEGVTVWLICRLAVELGYKRAGWVAALLYATTSTPISVAIGGMETALVTCAGMTAICAYVEKRPVSFAAASGVLFLLRVDGLLLVAVLAVAWALRQRQANLETNQRLDLRAAIVFSAVVLPWVVFATAYFGSPIPTSMLAKLAVYARIRTGTLPNVGDFETQFTAGPVQWSLSVLFLAGAIHLFRSRPEMRAPIVWLVGYYGAMLVSRVPAFGWYFLPPLPVYYLCAAVGLSVIVGAASPERHDRLALAAIVVIALPLLWHLRSITRDIATAQAREDEIRRPLGEWLARQAQPSETVMLEPIGYIGYYSHLRVLDMIGLVSPEVIPCYRKEVANPLDCVVEKEHPDWLVLRPDERLAMDPSARPPAQGGSDRLHGEYRWVCAFPDPRSGPAFEVYRREDVKSGGFQP